MDVVLDGNNKAATLLKVGDGAGYSGLTVSGVTFKNATRGVYLGNDNKSQYGADNISFTDCTFEDLSYAGIYAQRGNIAVDQCKFQNIKSASSTAAGVLFDTGYFDDRAYSLSVTNSTFTNITGTSSNEKATGGVSITGTGTVSKLTVTGNTFDNAGKIWFYGADLGNVTFEKNKVLGDTYVTTDEAEDGTTLDVDRNYWGGSAPSETQVVGENVTGKDVYYVVPEMNESNLNTYAPYTVVLVYGNGMSEEVKDIAKDSALVLPAAPSKNGYIFMGWKCSDGHTHEAGETVVVNSDLTFTAVWSALPDIEPGEPSGPDEPVEPSALPFVDVSANAWYYESVKASYEAGLMNGVTDTEFAPNAPLTRAMIWTIIARASGVETEGGATWYAKAQEWAVTNGVSDGEDPMGNVTREQLVTMLWRLNGSEVMTGYIGNYIDTGDISEWANNAMLWAVQNGIIEGDENMALTPKADTTRAQAATFFVRYLTVA